MMRLWGVRMRRCVCVKMGSTGIHSLLAIAMGACASVPDAASAPTGRPPPEQRLELRQAVPNSAEKVATNSKETFVTKAPSDCTPNMPAAEFSGAPAPAAASQDHSQEPNRPAPPNSEPAASAARYWRCDKGVLWPEKVDYCSQCPKGHTLSACSSMPFCHVCGGSTSVCMSCAEGCSYGVCSVCLAAAPLIAPSGSLELSCLGVSPAFLKEFKTKWADVTRGCTTGQVCHQLLKPLTSRSKCSLCEDLIAAGSAEVGRASVVMSHSWSSLFDDSVDAAIEAVEDGSMSNQFIFTTESARLTHRQVAAFIWFDVFSYRQHDIPQDSSAQTSVITLMSEIVAKTGSLALMLHPFDNPLSLKRAWCIYELFCCVRGGGRLTVTLTPAERDRFAEQSDVAAFSAMLSRIDTRSASCTLQDEQAAIMQVLEREVGIDKTDDMVRQALVVWLESQQLERMSPVQAEFEPPEVAEASALFAEAKSLHDRNLLLEAEQPARRAVELRARALGADSGETWAAKLLLASLLKKQKKLDEAKPLYEEVLAAARQVLGNDHEETLACMNNLAVLLKQQGKLDDARALYEEALQYKRSKFGVHHASTLTSMSNLAGLLKAQGRLEEARVLYEESLLGHRTTLGPLHPNTLTDIWNFALFLSKVGEPVAAAALLRECYDGWQQVLGHEHLNTIMCKKAMEQLGVT